MRGLFGAIGSVASRLNRNAIRSGWVAPPLAAVTEEFGWAGGWGFISRPPDEGGTATFVSSDGSVRLAIDGYLRTDLCPESASGEEHIRAWLDSAAAHGVSRALRSINVAAFVLILIDSQRGETWVLSDALTLVSVYFADLGRDGLLVSTRPVALAGCPGVSGDIDWVAMAEWLHCMAPYGDRCPLQGIRYLTPGSCLVWKHEPGTLRVESWPSHPLLMPYTETTPGPEEIFEAFQVSCRRQAAVVDRVAHFQSGGFDSRFILANWPGENPPCFTYGDAQSAEVQIARRVAAVRGSEFHHVSIPPGRFVQDFEALYRLSGATIHHTRYLGTKEMRELGYRGALDGLLGDVLLGGSYYSGVPSRSRFGKIASLLARPADAVVRLSSLDRIAEWLYQDAFVPRPLDVFCSPDFAGRIKSSRDAVLHDIAGQVRRIAPLCPTETLLVRYFKIVNRGMRWVNIQACHSRAHVEVLFPFMGDRDFFRLVFGMKPSRMTYLKTYILLFRKFQPKYAAVPVNHSLLPLGYPAWFQRLFESATTNLGLRDRWAEARFGGKPDFHSHDGKFDEAYWRLVLDEVGDCLAPRAHIEGAMRRVKAGEPLQTGVLRTLLPISRWIKASGTVFAMLGEAGG